MNEPSVVVREQEVGPRLAAEWLATMATNRKLRSGRVQELAQMMRLGQWQMNGQPLIFDTAGQLIDGQHRLNAVIEADTAVRFLIVCGVAPSAMANIDTGLTRLAGDVLHMAGLVDTLNLNSMVSLILDWERLGGGDFVTFGHSRHHPQEVLARINAEPALPGILRETCTIVPKKILQPGASAFLNWLLAQCHSSQAAFFLARLGDGQGLVRGDPVYALRERLLSIRSNHGRSGNGQDRAHYVALSIKAWNAYMHSRKMLLLTIRSGEQFPAIEE